MNKYDAVKYTNFIHQRIAKDDGNFRCDVTLNKTHIKVVIEHNFTAPPLVTTIVFIVNELDSASYPLDIINRKLTDATIELYEVAEG